MKKLAALSFAVAASLAAGSANAFFFDSKNKWEEPECWYDPGCNPYDEWDPRYWLNEMEDMMNSDDDYPFFGPYGPYGPMMGPYGRPPMMPYGAPMPYGPPGVAPGPMPYGPPGAAPMPYGPPGAAPMPYGPPPAAPTPRPPMPYGAPGYGPKQPPAAPQPRPQQRPAPQGGAR